MVRGNRWLTTAVILTLAASTALAVPAADPLTVLSAGGGKASVYVAPITALGSSEISRAVLLPKYSRGATPLQTPLAPGEYLVLVMAATEYGMRDVMARAGELIWDGYDQHAVVCLPETNRWRCAQGYVVTKEAGQPLTVFAVFTDEHLADQVQTFSPSSGAGTKFRAGQEAGLEQLEEAGVPTGFSEELLEAAGQGRKALLTTGPTRWAISVERPDRLLIRQGRANSNWSGHRLTVLAEE